MLAALAGCAEQAAPPPDIESLSVPAGAGSLAPRLHALPGRAPVLSWLEPAGQGHTLRFSRLVRGGFSEPLTVSTGIDWFVNWADTPSVVALPGGPMAAHWLEKSGPGTYSYDVRVAISGDRGASWDEPVSPHRDGTRSEHGFAQLFPDHGQLGAVWLDGRRTDEGGPMTLRYGRLDGYGELVAARELDERVCDCCMTAATHTEAGLLVVYRDRSEEEIRDIYRVVRTREGWHGPLPVHRDGWEIAGCPVNGPSVAATGNRAAVAWFTAAGGRPVVKLAFSEDGGLSFAGPLVVDDSSPAGRTDVVMDGEGGAWVLWLDGEPEPGRVRLRRYGPDGPRGEPLDVVEVSASRSSGFPVMAPAPSGLLVAWTEPEAGLRAALVTGAVGVPDSP